MSIIRVIRILKCSRWTHNYLGQMYRAHGHAYSSLQSLEATTRDDIVYSNPVCMQVDKMMYACESSEDLLTLLVTHRGILYLHNLVTAIRLLRGFAEADLAKNYQPDCDDLFAGYNKLLGQPNVKDDALDSEALQDLTPNQQQIYTKAKSEILSHLNDPKNYKDQRAVNHSCKVADAIRRDERFDLLLHDLYKNRMNLDVVSACMVITSLDALGHCYYRLYNGILRRLLNLDIEASEIDKWGSLLLDTCDCFARAGFDNVPLYSQVCNSILKAAKQGQCEVELIIKVAKLYTGVSTYDHNVFNLLAEACVGKAMSPQNLGDVALAFAIHGICNKPHDRVLYWVASEIEKRHVEFNARTMSRCLVAFAKARLYFNRSWDVCTDLVSEHVQQLMTSVKDPQMSLAELALVVEYICTFNPTSSKVATMLSRVLRYMEANIDEMTEAIAINLAFSSCTMKCVDENLYMQSFIWRKIGSGTEWEQYKYRVFSLWLNQVLLYPHFKVNLPRRCIANGQREWLYRHGIGLFNTHLNEIRQYLCDLGFKALVINAPLRLHMNMNLVQEQDDPSAQKKQDQPSNPIEAIPYISVLDDANCDKELVRFIICEKNIRNAPQQPLDVDLLIKHALEHFGHKVESINFQHWESMSNEDRRCHLTSLMDQYVES